MLKNLGMLTKIGLVMLFTIVVTGIYQINLSSTARICGLPGEPYITAPRVKLRDGRYLAYKETGVPKENAKFKIVFVHGFGNSRHDVVVAVNLKVIKELGVYIVSFDRAGYGESDSDPKRTVKSTVLDVEDLADQLKLGDRFYIIGFSMGGQTVWGSLKYIPHRLAGAALLAPVVNYWWTGFPANLSEAAYRLQLPQDQWALWVVHYFPWLTYWWNTQKLFPGSSVAAGKAALSRLDYKLIPRLMEFKKRSHGKVKKQGEYESLYRDMMIGFGSWDFSPMDLTNPFTNEQGSVHLWQGNEDTLVPFTLQRYIVQRLPWIKYHEVAGAGHLFPFADGINEAILRTLLLGEK